MCGGKVGISPIVKEKRRNSEKRKEKSRDAARCRRSKESEIFYELSSQLPLPTSVATQLDKASVMRLTVGYLKIRDFMKIFFPDDSQLESSLDAMDSVYASVLNGFLLVLSEEGDVIYLSENVEDVIGISQVEMIGQSIYDFSHPCDHEEIKSLLTSKPALSEEDILQDDTISFFIRMKSTIKSKSRTVSLKSSTYQVIHYIGHRFNKPQSPDSKDCPTFYLVFIGKTIPHPTHVEVLLDKEIFISRHSPDMKFTYMDERISEFLGFKSSELLGQSVFSYHHALDASSLVQSYKTLFSKGQCETGYYRFLSKYGGYVWVVTQATLIYENSTKPECVVCLNYVLSKVQNQNEIVSDQQEEAELEVEKVADILPLAKPTVILSSTRSIFAPKESVMSKDFLNFPDADILLFQEPLKDAKLTLELDLFPDDPCTIGSGICDDPFITYRDDSLSSPSYCGTPESSLNLHTSNSTSPDHFNTTPSTPDSGSLSDMPGLDPIDEFSNLDLKFTMPHSVSDKEADKESFEDADLEFRAPFISMNMDDDFPLISPSNSVMWGPQEPTKKKPINERLPEPSEQRIIPKPKPPSENPLKSSLAALLQSDVKKSPPSNNKTVSRKDSVPPHRKWTNSHGPSLDHNNRHNRSQKHFAPAKSYYGGGGNGHIIMLDTIPLKKQQSTKQIGSQRRNGGHLTTTNNGTHHSQSFGSHTTTVKVNDRLIKVQVSLSELPNSSIEQKQPFPSPPDPPPKRTRPSKPGHTESPKRLKVDNGLISAGQGIATDSVLFNLLISGEDASHGYLCSSNSRYSENKLEPALLSLSSVDNSPSDSSQFPELPASESEIIDSFLNISQYDAEVNAPIQSSYLLTGDDLLSALDNQPLLRNVSALV